MLASLQGKKTLLAVIAVPLLVGAITAASPAVSAWVGKGGPVVADCIALVFGLLRLWTTTPVGQKEVAWVGAELKEFQQQIGLSDDDVARLRSAIVADVAQIVPASADPTAIFAALAGLKAQVADVAATVSTPAAAPVVVNNTVRTDAPAVAQAPAAPVAAPAPMVIVPAPVAAPAAAPVTAQAAPAVPLLT